MDALVLLLLVWVLGSECSDQKNMTAEPGDTITLPCQAVSNRTVTVVEWTRNDLGYYCILLYRDSQFDPENQHPSYKNRVDLLDRQMKDGDVSLVLSNVTIDDRGTYECRVVQSGARSSNLDARPISIIYLDVSPRTRAGSRGTRAGPAGLMVRLTPLLLMSLI